MNEEQVVNFQAKKLCLFHSDFFFSLLKEKEEQPISLSRALSLFFTMGRATTTKTRPPFASPPSPQSSSSAPGCWAAALVTLLLAVAIRATMPPLLSPSSKLLSSQAAEAPPSAPGSEAVSVQLPLSLGGVWFAIERGERGRTFRRGCGESFRGGIELRKNSPSLLKKNSNSTAAPPAAPATHHLGRRLGRVHRPVPRVCPGARARAGTRGRDARGDRANERRRKRSRLGSKGRSQLPRVAPRKQTSRLLLFSCCCSSRSSRLALGPAGQPRRGLPDRLRRAALGC